MHVKTPGYPIGCQPEFITKITTVFVFLLKFTWISTRELSVPDNSFNKLCTHFVLTAKKSI